VKTVRDMVFIQLYLIPDFQIVLKNGCNTGLFLKLLGLQQYQTCISHVMCETQSATVFR